MAGEWETVPLGSLIETNRGISYGIVQPGVPIDDGIPIVRVTDIRNGRIATSDPLKVAHTIEAAYARTRLQGGELLLTLVGTVGEAAVVPESLAGWNTARAVAVIPVRKDIGAYWVKLALQSPEVQQIIDSRLNTTVQATLNLRDVAQLPIVLPPVPEQRAIAHILGTLDDKIELNRRMSETLEEMAHALFKSWFVDFDPVRAKLEGRWQRGQSLPGLPAHLYDLFPDRFTDSELGEIPEGWEVGAIENLCESITSGGTPARMNAAFWNEGTIPWFKTGELLDRPLLDSEEHITEMALADSSCKLWPEGTILFALYASPTVGRLGVLTSPGTSNQAAAGLMAKASYGIPFLHRVLLDARPKLQSIAVGAAQQNINQAVLKSHQIVVPSMALAMEYSRRISAADAKQTALAREMQNLADLRDTLLPGLISGELRVKGAEEFVRRNAV